MKFWAKVRFKGEKNAEYLIRAFFKEFNRESSIVIRGDEAKVEIIFDKTLPFELIETINHCDVIEFNFGKALGEYSEDETKLIAEEEETSEQTEQVAEEEETSEQTIQAGVEKEFSQRTECPKKAETTKVVNVKTVSIPLLEEFAKKAISFEHFVKLVAEFLEMNKRQEFFINLVIVATEVEKMSWKELEKALNNKSVRYSQWDRVWTSQQVAEKLKDYSVTLLPFLNTLRQYKDYSFGQEQSEESSIEQVAEEKVIAVVERTSSEIEETTPKNRRKMACMPEIPQFEETLESVDITQPIEDRVRGILTAMGWKKKTAEEQKEIFEIANTAVRLKDMTFDAIFLKANIPMESSIEARMTFSKFINDFVREYGSDKKVKLLNFLKQLQKIVICESEIGSFTDFTD